MDKNAEKRNVTSTNDEHVDPSTSDGLSDKDNDHDNEDEEETSNQVLVSNNTLSKTRSEQGKRILKEVKWR